MKKALCIYYSNSSMQTLKENMEYMTFEHLVRVAKNRDFVQYINKYRSVAFYCHSFTSFAKPFLVAVICRLMTVGECAWVDDEGRVKKIGTCTLLVLFSIFVFEHLTYRHILRKVRKELDILRAAKYEIESSRDFGIPLYLRCDLSYGYIAGGSIGHIAGVLNSLEDCTGGIPFFISTDIIPTVNEKIKQNIIRKDIPYGNVRDISSIAFNMTIYRYLEDILADKKIIFLYQRSALNAYAGMQYALKHGIPFVLEYNGSEVWISNKWGGRKLRAKELSEKIERLTFEKATLIICVSAPLKEQLLEMGIEEDKIIVNPNGVNPEMYSPFVDGAEVRRKMGVTDTTVVIGFIGTFGAWHGTDVLAEAFAYLVREVNLETPIHLLLIGDGLKMPDVKKVIQANRLESVCTLAGVVPQNQGPIYLAACDILVSPQIRNADGTPFFGSPTKLFEYMAMGKAIVTSDMDQMAEIFEHGKTALLCEPGNALSLAQAIKTLVQDQELRMRLGEAARMEVCSKYTWQLHTEKIVKALKYRLEK